MSIPTNRKVPGDGSPGGRIVNSGILRLGTVPSFLLFCAAFYVAYLYGMSFQHINAAPFWPPDAILLTALLLTPMRTWWLYLLAPLPIRLLVATPPDVSTWFLISVYANDSFKAIGSALILRRLNRWDPRLENIQQLVQFFLVAVVGIPMLSAFAGALSRQSLGDNFWPAFQQWFLGASLVNLILTPMMLYWALGGVSAVRSASNARRLEGVLVFAVLTFVGIKALSGDVSGLANSSVLIYFPFPLLLYSAIRFGLGGITTTLSLIAIAAIWSAEHGLGPLGAQSLRGDVLPLQLFLFATSIPLLCVAVLLNERERAVLKLQKTTEQLARTETLSLVMVTNVGLDGRWLKVPRTFCEFVGYSEAELLAGNFKDITHPDDLDADWSQCQRLINGEIQSFELEKRYIRKDGNTIWVYINCSIVSDTYGRPIHFLTYIKNITERKQAEEALQRLTGQLINLQDEERRRIAAELHDSLGQSLVMIKQRSMICLRDINGADRMTEQLEEISSTATAAIDELHEIAHNLRPYELDRLGLVKSVETLVAKLAKSLPIQLSAELDRIDGLLSPAAETSVYRIIQEALNNVIKHAHAHEAKVHVRKIEDQLVISVTDNGKGFTSPVSEGYNKGGFGLAGIAERVRLLGGSCVIESQPEKGTAVIVRIGFSEVGK